MLILHIYGSDGKRCCRSPNDGDKALDKYDSNLLVYHFRSVSPKVSFPVTHKSGMFELER